MLKIIKFLADYIILAILCGSLLFIGDKIILLVYQPPRGQAFLYHLYFYEWLLTAAFYVPGLMLIYTLLCMIFSTSLKSTARKRGIAVFISACMFFLLSRFTFQISVDPSTMKNIFVLVIITPVLMIKILDTFYLQR